MIIETNQIYLGNSYRLLKYIPDKSVDLVIIDPPYDFKHGGKMTGIFRDRGTRHFDALENTGLTLNYDYKSILEQLNRVMKCVNIYIWCNKEQLLQYLNFYNDKKYRFELFIWEKTNPMPLTNNRFLPDKEYCLWFGENGKVKLRGDYSTKNTVYREKANTDDKKIFSHPTIKPLEIIKNMVINSSDENDIVLDCFMGSGTTCVAAKELGRRYIGIEIDKNYFKIAKDRLNGITTNGQTSIFTDFDNVEVIKND